MSSPERHNLAELEDDGANVIVDNSNNYLSNNLYLSEDNIIMTTNASYQQEDFDSMTAIDPNDNCGQVSGNEGNWSELPSLVVENIYSFLGRPDRSRMSLVCSRWANEFDSPSLWKTMKFYLFEHDYSTEIWPQVRFARKYAKMFQHVEIICTRVRPHLIDEVCRQLTLFLQVMESSSQLITIKFLNMGNYFRQLNEDLYKGLLKTIIEFFNSQENLSTVVFQKSYFCKEEGMELLKTIFHSRSNTIRSLILRGFAYEAGVVVLSRQYMTNLSEVCWRIANVSTLELDYTQIFEDALNSVYENLCSGEYQLDKKKEGMSALSIYCEGNEELGSSRILPGTWKYLVNTFPRMKVKMDVTINSYLITEMKKFLAEEVPLQTLDFRNELYSRTDISALFTHLQVCKYHYHLEVLNVLWMSSIADFARSVVSLIQCCRKLQTFHLHAKYTSMEIENAVKALLEYHPRSLKAITLWFNYVSADQYEDNLKEISEKYYQLFNEQGIQFFLIIDPSRRQRRMEPNAIVG